MTWPMIVGAGRSGTTLLRAMFDHHPELTIPGESGFMVRFGKPARRHRYETGDGFNGAALYTDLMQHKGFSRWRLDPEAVRAALVDAGLDGYAAAMRRLYGLYAGARGKAHYGDKTPTYVLHIPLLADLLEETRFIHIVRDGRDVALSNLDISEWGPEDLATSALDWRRRVLAGRRAGQKLGPGRYREIRYEDLVNDPGDELRSLCDFIDLEYDPVMLRYFEEAPALTAPEAFPHHHQRLALPPTKGLRDWRRQMGPADVARFERIAGDVLSASGYELRTNPHPLRARFTAVGPSLRTGVRRLTRSPAAIRHRLAPRGRT